MCRPRALPAPFSHRLRQLARPRPRQQELEPRSATSIRTQQGEGSSSRSAASVQPQQEELEARSAASTGVSRRRGAAAAPARAHLVARAAVKTTVTALGDHCRGFRGCAHVEQRRTRQGHGGGGGPAGEREGMRGWTKRGQRRGRYIGGRRIQWGVVFWRCIWSMPRAATVSSGR